MYIYVGSLTEGQGSLSGKGEGIYCLSFDGIDTPTTKVVGFLFHRVPHDLVRLYHKAMGISLTHSPQA